MTGKKENVRAVREAHWRERIAACESSGKSIVAWCRETGISVSKYHWWKGELRRRDGNRPERPLFAEVFARRRLTPAPSGIEVLLGGERVVRVSRGFDAGTLGSVVRVLEALGAPEAREC